VSFIDDELTCSGILTDGTDGIWCSDQYGKVICKAFWECYAGDCYISGAEQYTRSIVYTTVALLWGVVTLGAFGANFFCGFTWIQLLNSTFIIRTAIVIQILLSLVIIWTPQNYNGLLYILSGLLVLTSIPERGHVAFGVAFFTFFSIGGWNSFLGNSNLGYNKAHYELLAKSYNTDQCFLKYALSPDDWRCNILLLVAMWATWIILILQFVYMGWGVTTMVGPPETTPLLEFGSEGDMTATNCETVYDSEVSAGELLTLNKLIDE